AGPRCQLVALFARRSDHRRHGVTCGSRCRLAASGVDEQLRSGVPAVELHVLLDHLHVRARRPRVGRPAARAVREAGVKVNPDRVVGLLALVLAVTAPLYLSAYWVGTLLTQVLFLGIVAASLIFLSAYGGMVSLAQVSIYGIAGFVVGNATTNGNTKGLNLGWSPWWGVVLALVITVVVGVLFGALASRSVGIYFLMITLTYS